MNMTTFFTMVGALLFTYLLIQGWYFAAYLFRVILNTNKFIRDVKTNSKKDASPELYRELWYSAFQYNWQQNRYGTKMGFTKLPPAPTTATNEDIPPNYRSN